MSRLRATAVLILAVAAIWPSTALAFHEYSFDRDQGDPSFYTGGRVLRNDQDITGSVNSDCSATFTAPIVYQPIWVVMDAAGSSWVELGSAYKTCSQGSIYFWYGYWSQPGTYTGAVFTQTFGPALSSHTFSLNQTADDVWHFYVDVTDFYNSRQWSSWGNHVDGGLESYDASAHVSAETYTLSTNISRYGWQYFGSCSSCPIVDPAMSGSLDPTQPWILTASEP